MYEIVFYEPSKGYNPVLEYIQLLQSKNDKDGRIKLGKIRDYIKILQLHGTGAGEPYIKHLDGDIWELRPIRSRILFAAWEDKHFVLLHCFLKQFQKTPKSGIDKAKRNLQDLRQRTRNYG